MVEDESSRGLYGIVLKILEVELTGKEAVSNPLAQELDKSLMLKKVRGLSG